MSISPVNIDQVMNNIDSIVSDIKTVLSDNASKDLNLASEKVDLSEFENACKILGCGRDYNIER